MRKFVKNADSLWIDAPDQGFTPRGGRGLTKNSSKATRRLILLPHWDVPACVDALRAHHAEMQHQHVSMRRHALPQVTPELMNQARGGGFTVHDHTGDAPTDGYMVSRDKNTEKQVGDIRDLNEGVVQNYINQHAKQLAHPKAYLGGWLDNGKFYLDVSHHYPDLYSATRDAHRANQLGIYDLKNGQTIYTDDAGWRVGLPAITGGRREQGRVRQGSIRQGCGGDSSCDGCGGEQRSERPSDEAIEALAHYLTLPDHDYTQHHHRKWDGGDGGIMIMLKDAAVTDPMEFPEDEPGIPSMYNIKDVKVPHLQQMENTGQDLGTHHSKVFKSPSGMNWLVKPAPSSGFLADGDVATSKLQAYSGLPTSPTFKVQYKPGQAASAQLMFGGAKDAYPTKTLDPEQVNDADLLTLQKHHALDWLTGNHDAHGGQFIRTPDGQLIGIDKGQSFKHYNHDRLHWRYHPNGKGEPNHPYGGAYNEAEPVYNTLYRNFANGGREVLDPREGELGDFIQHLQDIPDDDFRSLLHDYAHQASAAGSLGLTESDEPRFVQNDPESFLNYAVQRKNSLKEEMGKLYDKAKANRMMGRKVSKKKKTKTKAPSLHTQPTYKQYTKTLPAYEKSRTNGLGTPGDFDNMKDMGALGVLEGKPVFRNDRMNQKGRGEFPSHKDYNSRPKTLQKKLPLEQDPLPLWPEGKTPQERKPVTLYRGNSIDMRKVDPNLAELRAHWYPNSDLNASGRFVPGQATILSPDQEAPPYLPWESLKQYPRQQDARPQLNGSMGRALLDYLKHEDHRHWSTDPSTSHDFADVDTDDESGGDPDRLKWRMTSKWPGLGEDPLRTDTQGEYPEEKEITVLPGTRMPLHSLEVFANGKWNSVLPHDRSEFVSDSPSRRDRVNEYKKHSSYIAEIEAKIEAYAQQSITDLETVISKLAGMPEYNQMKPSEDQPNDLGSHGAHLFSGNDGDWLVKPAASGLQFLPKLDDAVGQLQSHVGLEAPETHAINTPHGLATAVKWDPKASPAFPQNYLPSATELSPQDRMTLQKHQAFDWMISNHDPHVGNWLRTGDGGLMGIDKGQALKYFGRDRLDPNFHPNFYAREPVYNQMWRDHAHNIGEPMSDPREGELGQFVQSLQNIPDDEMRRVFRPYAEGAAEAGVLGLGANNPKEVDPRRKLGDPQFTPNDIEGFLNHLVSRKNSLADQLGEYYDRMSTIRDQNALNPGSVHIDNPDELHAKENAAQLQKHETDPNFDSKGFGQDYLSILPKSHSSLGSGYVNSAKAKSKLQYLIHQNPGTAETKKLWKLYEKYFGND